MHSIQKVEKLNVELVSSSDFSSFANLLGFNDGDANEEDVDLWINLGGDLVGVSNEEDGLGVPTSPQSEIRLVFFFRLTCGCTGGANFIPILISNSSSPEG